MIPLMVNADFTRKPVNNKHVYLSKVSQCSTKVTLCSYSN